MKYQAVQADARPADDHVSRRGAGGVMFPPYVFGLITKSRCVRDMKPGDYEAGLLSASRSAVVLHSLIAVPQYMHRNHWNIKRCRARLAV